MLEQSPACLWLVREDLVFERISALFGYRARQDGGELTGGCALRCSRGGHGADVVQPVRARAAGETLYLRERSGSGTWYISVFPVRGKDGTRYAGGMAREITPWKSAEQELRNTVLGALKAQEFERNTLSKFLHDKVGQNLTALGLQLDLARMDVESVSPGDLRRASPKSRRCWKPSWSRCGSTATI